MKPQKGTFIVFEGIDGSGKTTQVKLSAEYLKTKGYKVLTTFEPTNNIIGRLIHKKLKEAKVKDPDFFQLLYCADRALHLEEIILPALKENKIILCDRYFLATLAYGALGIKNINWLKILIKELFLVPNLTFYIKISPQEAMQRIKKAGRKTEYFEKIKKMKKISQNYDKIIKQSKGVHIINGNQSRQMCFNDIKKIINRYL